MQSLKMSLVVALVLGVVGCGGGSGSSATDSAISLPLTKIETVEDAKSSFKSVSAVDSIDTTGLTSSSTTNKLQYKTTNTYLCDSGSITIIEDTTINTIIGDGCSIYSENIYIDGTMTEEQLDDGSSRFVLSNITLKDATIEIRATTFTSVEDMTNHWYTLDGTVGITTACFVGNYNFKTIEKIYELADGSAIASGIMELNGVRYTFENPNVTIKIGDSEETIPQSQLENNISTATSCQ